MIVVDTNIIAYMAFSTPQSPKVTALYEMDSDWETVSFWKSEFLSVVSLYFRKRIVTYDEALIAIDYAEKLINVHEHRISPLAVMALIRDSNCSAYDCEFVALALELEAKLITYDREVLKEFPRIALKPEDFIAQSQQ